MLWLSSTSSPTTARVEDGGNPWWIWILVLLALIGFVAVVLWWWMRAFNGEEEAVSPATSARVARAGEAKHETPVTSAPPDDLKRIEGIGPKISQVLRAAGIVTFAQLAETSVDRLQSILEADNPNLLRLADPTTWPEQATLAAARDWGGLESLQDELKGGRRT
jgi:predicted flap endonuclease-1-like 5' DNA nuclease